MTGNRPLLKLFASPVVGFLSLGIVLVTLIARLKLPLRLPGALAGILCGVIHSPLASGAMFIPWSPPEPIVWHIAAGYLVLALVFLGMKAAVTPTVNA